MNMRRMTAAVCACMVMLPASITQTAPIGASYYMPGDVDGSGALTILDVVIAHTNPHNFDR